MRNRIFIWFLLSLISTACFDEWRMQEVEDTVVIQGYLVHGTEGNFIRISRVAPIFSNEIIPVVDADVKVEWRNRIFTFNHDPNQEGYYIYERDDFEVVVGETYILQVLVDDIELSSQTVVPPPPDQLRLSGVTLPLNVESRSNDTIFVKGLQSVINLKWENDLNQKYVARLDGQNEAGGVVVANFGNEELDTAVMSRFDGDIIEGNELDIWDFDISKLGVQRVLLFAVNEEYKDVFFLEDAAVDQVFSSPSNINNGVGLFTAVSVDSVFFVAIPTEE